MKKLQDKTVIIICSICMTLMFCFGISYKMANKTYADDLTPITDKQRLGAFLSSLAFSCGVRVYIATVGTYEWLVDNFNSVMLRLQFTMSANDVYQNAVDNYDNENKTYKLDPEFTKAVQEYLKYLQGEGINEYSGTVELGSYEVSEPSSYTPLPSNTNNIVSSTSDGYYMVKTDSDVRAVNYVFSSGNPRIKTFIFSENPFRYTIGYSQDKNMSLTPTNNAETYSINNKTYYYIHADLNVYSATNINGSYVVNVPLASGLANQTRQAYEYCYGAYSDEGTAETVAVNGKPNPYWSATEVTLDRDAEYKIDYSDTDGVQETSTLDQLIELVNKLIETGTQTQQETIPQVDVQIFTPTIDPTTVDIPTLFDGIPEIITPECVGLGSCLISGVQTASQHLQNVYNSNSSVANYTMVSLAIGIALYILTGGI